MTMNPALLLESALPNGVVSSIFLFLGPGRRYLVAESERADTGGQGGTISCRAPDSAFE